MKITFTKEEYEWMMFEACNDGATTSMSDFDMWIREEYLPFVLFDDHDIVEIEVEQ